jgi:8-oxo-dGTP pyrophosphatase MutT (NUDIX family)
MREIKAAITFIEQGPQYLLQLRDGDPRKGAAGLIGAFGGKIEPGETEIRAAQRELGEETSLTASIADLEYRGEVTVISDRDLLPARITATVFRLIILESIKVVAYDGQLVRMTAKEILTQPHRMTPATLAAYKATMME